MIAVVTPCQWTGIVAGFVCLVALVGYLAHVAPSATADLDEALFPFENSDHYGEQPVAPEPSRQPSREGGAA